MTLTASYVDDVFRFCDSAVSGGYVVAMVLICALQYLYHLIRSRQSAEVNRRLCREIEEVQTDLRVVSRDRTLTWLENQILREFTSELDLSRTIDQLVRRFVGDGRGGFAAYVSVALEPHRVVQCRALSEEARRNLTIDRPFLERVAREGVVALGKADLFGSRLLDALSPGERMRISQLFLAGVGEPNDLAGVIVTTSLFPAGAPPDQQIELTRRLMQSLTGIVKRTAAFDDCDRQLQSINEIMELRTVIDRKHASPLDMVEAFVDRLRRMLNAERAVLFLVTPANDVAYRALCRCGDPLPSGKEKNHSDGEAILADATVKRKAPRSLDAEDLKRLGVDAVIGSAMIAPVVSPSGVAGALCFTRRSREPFAEPRPGLISWATNYLSETMLKAMHQAVSEWHARQDALTGLANRRTFDRELTDVVEAASRQNHSCALLMLDVDRFKEVNDRHGHPAGDEVLRFIARVLKAVVKSARHGASGIVARFGGEEFAILLSGAQIEDAVRVAETIRAAVEIRPIKTQQAELKVTVSVGVAVFPQHGPTASDLIAAADAALYQAKEAGRNRVHRTAAAR